MNGGHDERSTVAVWCCSSSLRSSFFDEPGDQGALLAQSRNDRWIGHPHMVGFRLSRLNAVVVALAR